MLRFFEDESCGQCTPCALACEKNVKLMQADRMDKPLLGNMFDRHGRMTASISVLGQARADPDRMVIKHFPPTSLILTASTAAADLAYPSRPLVLTTKNPAAIRVRIPVHTGAGPPVRVRCHNWPKK